MDNKPDMQSRLTMEKVALAYDQQMLFHNLCVAVPDGAFTVIVGRNGCGKSTLLRLLARLLMPQEGQIILDGKNINSLPSKQVARTIGLLPQRPQAPDGMKVADLVSKGRYPHQGFLQQWSKRDEQAVATAMQATNIDEFAERALDELSGGQSQRVWIAMILAQETPILLLDEPTTFLDMAYQIELLELLTELNRQGRTIVAVLHDLNHACRYASHLIAMRKGNIVAVGEPQTIISEQLVEQVFDLPCLIIKDPVSQRPLIIPKTRAPEQF